MKILHTFSLLLIGTIISFCALTGNSQNVAINTTGASADPSAMLDVKSTTAGVLIPRMSTSQRNAISAPAIGLQIFNTDCNVLNYWTGTCWVSSGAIPAPDSISSSVSTILCSGVAATFSIPAITGATAYYWTAPPGANITSGQGSTSVNVTFNSASGNVCVTANDACETSQPTCRQVSVNAPATVGAITGTTSFCAGAASTYSIPTVTGATSYTWSGPSGATITSGQGTPSVIVTFGSTGGNISVYATTSCGNTNTQTLPVTLTASIPATPGTITGTAILCSSTNSNQVYYISPVTGALSYIWTVPSNVTILSGQGTASITVNVSTSFSGGTISVATTNACGTSTASSLAITTSSYAPLAPGPITGPASVSASSSANYSVSPATHASGYKWTITPAATISAGQGTIQSTISFGSSAQSYTIACYDSNACGKSPVNVLTMSTSTVCPVAALGTSHQTFSYTGALQNWTIPCGVSVITAYMWGAGGAYANYNGEAPGGTGAFVAATMTVTPGNTLNIIVGQGAVYGTNYPNGTYGGGGGNAPVSSVGAGGGRSAIQINGSGVDVLTAGGGGGGGGGGSNYNGNYYANGGGGGANGTSNTNCTTEFGVAGTATAGGAGGTACSTYTSYNGYPGTQYQGGNITSSSYEGWGGAGGGGYYGGGSGGSYYGAGGGGGSSFPATAPTGPVTGFLGGTPLAGTTEANGSSTNPIYPPDHTTTPYSTYWSSPIGEAGLISGGNGEVVIIY